MTWCKGCLPVGKKVRANYNLLGKTAEYCRGCSPPGSIDVNSPTCEKCNTKRAIFSAPGTKKAEFCGDCMSPGYIDVTRKMCRKCKKKQPCFGPPDGKSEFCKGCAPKWYEDVVSTRCKACHVKHSFFGLPGTKKADYCFDCAPPGYENVKSPRCKAPNCSVRVSNPQYNGHCLRCFRYMFPDEPVARNYKVKEVHVTDFIKTIELPVSVIDVTYDKVISEGCSRRRPDALINFGYSVIALEIDEDQHGTYECENKRMMQIFEDVGSVPMVMIRFNPDAYERADGTRIPSCFEYTKQGMPVIRDQTVWNNRLEILRETLQTQLDIAACGPFSKEVVVIQLFMDGYVD